ncbi:MAG: NUDIX domain-containing protein [Knoellia sp.]
MSAERQPIRVISLVVLPNADGVMHAVQVMAATRENPQGFHRLIGGGVVFGETTRDAAVREVREELGADLSKPVLLGVLESKFEVDRVPAHEIAFVYTGRLDPSNTVPPEGGMFADNGLPMAVEWRHLDDPHGSIPLYPSGSGALAWQAVAAAPRVLEPSPSRVESSHSWRGSAQRGNLKT